MQGMADLVQVPRRVFLDEEADRAARLLEIGIAGMALFPCREDRAGSAIPAGNQLGRPRLQGIAVRRREKALEHQEAVALVGCKIRLPHWTTRCMMTGRSATAISPTRMARRRRAIASSASL